MWQNLDNVESQRFIEAFIILVSIKYFHFERLKVILLQRLLLFKKNYFTVILFIIAKYYL